MWSEPAVPGPRDRARRPKLQFTVYIREGSDTDMAPAVQIAVGHRGDWTLLTVSGEIDMATVPELARVGETLDGDLILDLSGVAFIDSSGLGELLRFARRPAKLVMVASPAVRRLLDLTRVEDQFDLVDGLDSVV
jgi:anti-sigma B factor antagonist